MNRIDTTIDVLAPDSTRALVLADDPLVREGLARRLGLAAAGAAGLADDLGDAVLRAGANVVLWDLGPLGDHDGELVAALARLQVPVVALAPAAIKRRELVAAGIAGVVGRESPSATVSSALGSVLHGLRVTDALLTDELDRELELGTEIDHAPRSANGPREPDSLTAREHEVVQLMAEGLSNKQIGDRLGISAHTAKFHVNAVLGKLDASTRTEAVVRAVQRGVVML